MFTPRVKEENITGTSSAKLLRKVFFRDAESRKMGAVLSEFMPYLKLREVSESAKADFTVSVIPGISDKAEYYEISSHGGKLELRAKDKRGLVNAAATLAQMFFADVEGYSVIEGEIKDYPDTSYRSFMIDTGRKYIPTDEFRAQLLTIAKAKMNKCHIHLSDAEGYSIAFDSYPALPSPDSEGRKYTKDDIRELIAYADMLALDIIPEIDMPAHSFGLIEAYPELSCKTAEKAHTWCMCISREETYSYVKRILGEIAELFPYEYIHVGADELNMTDVVNKNGRRQMQDWCECELCNKKFGKKTSVTDRFYYFANEVYKIVTSLGKKMMMWNDDIDISKPVPLPRDILIEFWRVAAPLRGPREGCSMQGFIDAGFEVVNADFPHTYIHGHVDYDMNKTWNLRAAPADAGQKGYQILGAELCAWDVRAHYAYSIFPIIPFFADRCWNLAPIEDDAKFKTALTRFTLGPAAPKGFNIFDTCLTGVVMTGLDADIIREECDTPSLLKLLRSLKAQSANEKLFTSAVKKEAEKHIKSKGN